MVMARYIAWVMGAAFMYSLTTDNGFYIIVATVISILAVATRMGEGI